MPATVFTAVGLDGLRAALPNARSGATAHPKAGDVFIADRDNGRVGKLVKLFHGGRIPGDRPEEAPMTASSTTDTARSGAEVFASRIRPSLRAEDDGKFVAIDVTSGDYELDEDDYATVARLRSHRPSAEVWLERAGYPAAYQLRRL